MAKVQPKLIYKQRDYFAYLDLALLLFSFALGVGFFYAVNYFNEYRTSNYQSVYDINYNLYTIPDNHQV
jgi:hypothetical protein